jgi:UDP-4-amino-4,6-dideoxy-N-acetyl-beta-L-altrosamine N-acetyltransferase
MPTIQFRGVRLRPMTIFDQDLVLRWRSDQAIGRVMYSQLGVPSIDSQINWFRRIASSPDYEYFIIERRGFPIGVVNLANISQENSRTDWAFYIGEAQFRGTGVGALVEYAIIYYVFTWQKFSKLCCQVLSNNLDVAKMHRKFGFVEEGLLKKHFFRDGVWLDLYIFGMDASESVSRGYDKLLVSVVDK